MVSTRLQSTSGGETTVEHIFIGVSPVRVIRNVSTVSSPSHEIVPYSQPSGNLNCSIFAPVSIEYPSSNRDIPNNFKHLKIFFGLKERNKESTNKNLK